MSELDLLWAKSNPHKTLLCHSIDVACCAQALLKEGCMYPLTSYISHQCEQSQKQVLAFCGYLASLHDIGKIHPIFQQKALELPCVQTMKERGYFRNVVTQKPFRHERYTKTVIRRIWRTHYDWDDFWADNLSTILALHHQGKNGEGTRIASNQNPTWWEEQQLKLEQVLRQLFLQEADPTLQCKHIDGVFTTLTGLIILADWIASSSYFDFLTAENYSTYLEKSRKQAFVALKKCGLQAQAPLPAKEYFSELWPFLTQKNLRSIQKQCQIERAHTAKLYLIEAPMGEGKTESAIYLSTLLCEKYKKSGVYFALPTMATSNQMFKRLSEIFYNQGINHTRLLHAKAFLLEDINVEVQLDDDYDVATAWLAPLRKGLLSANAVGTVDQAMMGVLCAKYTVLRLLGLSNKVLIIDEVHAYDIYMSEIIDRLLAWCNVLDVPVVLLSATLPSARKKELLSAYGAQATIISDYPLITAVDEDGSVRQIPSRKTYMNLRFQLHCIEDQELEESVKTQWSTMGGVCCVLLNTVKKARAVFLRLLELGVPKEELLLFHARFPAKTRNELEEQCISLCGKDGKRPNRFIVIGTQVLEQSLDIDFDIMFTEIAPIDLLLQRVGRVFRHKNTKRPLGCIEPHIYVVAQSNHSFGVAEILYEKLLLQRTWDLLHKISILCIPKDMRWVIEEVYRETLHAEEFEAGVRKQFKEQLAQNHAKGIVLAYPDAENFFASSRGSPYDVFTNDDEDNSMLGIAKTRLSDESVMLAILEDELYENAMTEKPNLEVARLVISNSVSVRKKEVATFLPMGIEGKGRLRGYHIFKGSPATGIKDTKNRILCVDEDLGLIVKEA